MELVWVSEANVARNNWRDSLPDQSIFEVDIGRVESLNGAWGQIYHKAKQSRYDFFDGRNDPLAKDKSRVD